MKKYLRIILVLGVFGLLVLLRQLKGNDQPVIVGAPQFDSGNATTTSNTTQNSGMAQNSQMPMMNYKSGTYVGRVEDAFYGSVQVQVTISGGKVSNVTFLQYPNENSTSRFINGQAMPMLTQEALQAQTAQVNIISGASATSQAFQASLADALSQAK